MMLTQTEYARHRGVRPPHINRMVKAGRIPLEPNGKIDAAKADFALDGGRVRLNAPKPASAMPDSNTAKLTIARAGGAYYDAKMRELQYQKALGNALPLDGVVDAATVCGESVVRIVRSLSMCAEEITSAGARDGIAGVRSALKAIERDLLSRAGAAFEKMAAAASAAREAAAPDPDAPPIEEDEAA